MTVGAVAIGRNEGERLRSCIQSLQRETDHIVYADSGSTDGSVDLAASLGVQIVRITDDPFTAARGRQAGADALLEAWPDTQAILFIDGDCVLQSGFLPAARAIMAADANVAGVSGRRREERCEELFYSRLLEIDWDLRAGEADHVGGDSLMRVDAIRQVGGWPVQMIAGEDPEISFRMREAGWRIVRLETEMTLHDARMRHFSEYWRRAIRSGHAYAEAGWLHRHGAGRHSLRRAIGIVLYGCLLPPIALVVIPIFWPAAAVISLLYARMFAVVTLYSRHKGNPWVLSLAYASLNAICKPASAIGVVRYFVTRLTGKSAGLIEYKRTSS